MALLETPSARPEDVGPPVAAGPETPEPATVFFRACLPGLVAILGIDVAYWLGPAPLRIWLAGHWLGWMLALLALPLTWLVVTRRSPAVLGYRAERAFGLYMRGVAAGALWRLFAMLTSFYGWWDTGSGPTLGLAVVTLLFQLAIVPFLEETFFRGYLQSGLQTGIGPVPAILVQALLFALHPAHAAQGWRAFPAIFLFGLLAGLLYWRTRSIWIVYGAHGIANVLPGLVLAVAGMVY